MLLFHLFIYYFAAVFAMWREKSPSIHFNCLARRLRELRQPRLIAGGHPVDERLPDRDEAAEGAAQALQERQQALLRAPRRRAAVGSLAVETVASR